jgi:hypothetical protein
MPETDELGNVNFGNLLFYSALVGTTAVDCPGVPNRSAAELVQENQGILRLLFSDEIANG